MDVYQKLNDAKVDLRENQRSKNFREALEAMKRIFPGVHGRILDLCKPINKKYEPAISVVRGKNMDSIVVDDNKTAIECIKVSQLTSFKFILWR